MLLELGYRSTFSFSRVPVAVFGVRVEAESCLACESLEVEMSPQMFVVVDHTRRQLGVVGSGKLSWPDSIHVELGYLVGSIVALVGLRHLESLQIFYPVSEYQICVYTQ